jgi:hypothetical protein
MSEESLARHPQAEFDYRERSWRLLRADVTKMGIFSVENSVGTREQALEDYKPAGNRGLAATFTCFVRRKTSL